MYGITFQLRWSGNGLPKTGTVWNPITLTFFGEGEVVAEHQRDINRPTRNGPIDSVYDQQLAGYKFEWPDPYVQGETNTLTVAFTGEVYQGGGDAIFKARITNASHGFVAPYEFWMRKAVDKVDAFPCLLFGSPTGTWNTVTVNKIGGGVTSLARFAVAWQAVYISNRKHGLLNAYWDVALANQYAAFDLIFPASGGRLASPTYYKIGGGGR